MQENHSKFNLAPDVPIPLEVHVETGKRGIAEEFNEVPRGSRGRFPEAFETSPRWVTGEDKVGIARHVAIEARAKGDTLAPVRRSETARRGRTRPTLITDFPSISG